MSLQISLLSIFLRVMLCCHPGGTESALSSNSLTERLDFNQFGRRVLLYNHLSDPIARTDGEICVLAQVEQQDLDLAAVVAINDASTHVDKVLHCQARSRRDPAIVSVRDGKGQACGDESLAARRNNCCLTGMQVVPSSELGALDGKARRRCKFAHLELCFSHDLNF